MLADESWPEIPGAAVPLLVLLIGCLWLHLRVAGVRRLEATRVPGDPPTKAPRWMLRLAASRATTPVLAAIAGAVVVALVIVFRASG